MWLVMKSGSSVLFRTEKIQGQNVFQAGKGYRLLQLPDSPICVTFSLKISKT
jgi:hypothetical protein